MGDLPSRAIPQDRGFTGRARPLVRSEARLWAGGWEYATRLETPLSRLRARPAVQLFAGADGRAEPNCRSPRVVLYQL